MIKVGQIKLTNTLFDHHKYKGVCLHSQQSVEKGLKALLLEKGMRAPRPSSRQDPDAAGG
jgi:HEPN domain-containing protein